MSIRNLLFFLAVLLCSACSSDIFLDHNGNMPEQDKVDQVQLGMSKQEVDNLLGSPSLITGLNDNHWIYMSSTVRKFAFLRPEEKERSVLALSFDNDKVSKIDTRSLADGNNISIDTDETKLTERKLGFFRKYFGGVGNYTPFEGSKEQGL